MHSPEPTADAQAQTPALLKITRFEHALARLYSQAAFVLLWAPAAVGLAAFLGPAACSVIFSPISRDAEEQHAIISRGAAWGITAAGQYALGAFLLAWPLGVPLHFAAHALKHAGHKVPFWTIGLLLLCGLLPIAFQAVTQGLPVWVGPLLGAPAFAAALSLALVNRRRAG